jgi:hypothetical protein
MHHDAGSDVEAMLAISETFGAASQLEAALNALILCLYRNGPTMLNSGKAASMVAAIDNSLFPLAFGPIGSSLFS